jgi:hypothetical protein
MTEDEQQSAWQIVLCFGLAFAFLVIGAVGGCFDSCKKSVEKHGQVEGSFQRKGAETQR